MFYCTFKVDGLAPGLNSIRPGLTAEAPIGLIQKASKKENSPFGLYYCVFPYNCAHSPRPTVNRGILPALLYGRLFFLLLLLLLLLLVLLLLLLLVLLSSFIQ